MADNNKFDKEAIRKELQRKQMIALKASNEMLERAKESIMATKRISDDFTRAQRIDLIETAQEENLEVARNRYGLSKSDLDKMEYNEVSDAEKKKYEERLKKRGMTDEQMRQKALPTFEASIDAEANGQIKRHKRRRNAKVEEEEIVRLDNEEELMNSSMIKTEEDFNNIKRSREGKPDNDAEKSSKMVVEALSSKKVEVSEVKPVEVEAIDDSEDDGRKKTRSGNRRVTKKVAEKKSIEYTFDLRSIPDNVQYDVIPLPSNGECYPNKMSRIPVAYLTASDENLIASPHMYRDGKLIDTILSRKILDKSIKVEDLCEGDRDAIVLWLRGTGYGYDFPVRVRHPQTGKQYSINIGLDKFEYYPFNLKGDENGLFDYTLENGDVLKFKIMSHKDNVALLDVVGNRIKRSEYFNTIKYMGAIEEALPNLELNDTDLSDMKDCLADMKAIIDENSDVTETDNVDSMVITEEMTMFTVSVNGNTDKDYVRSYIENMRAKDAYAYRNYVRDNKPGVDFSFTVNIPQADGGGSFSTFLRLDDYVFVNV